MTLPIFDYHAAAWRDRAACKDLDTELFHPRRGGNTAAPKAVCAGCEVREPCLDDALATGVSCGIRGGMSERQRRGIRRRTGGGFEVAS